MQELTDAQLDLVDRACDFFKACPRDFDMPAEFRKPGFWTEGNFALLEKHAVALGRWAALPAGANKALVCESVAMDVDTHLNENEGTRPSARETAPLALAQISFYMEPEVFKTLTDPAQAGGDIDLSFSRRTQG